MSGRSAWKLYPIHPLFFSSSFKNRKFVKTAARSITLPRLSMGRSFYVHDGRKYAQVIYKKEMTGFKLGSFAITKTIGFQSKKKKKTKKSRK